MTDTYLKDPNAKLDYARDWSAWLQTSETIATSEWIVPVGITESVSPAPSNTTTVATIWLEGGTLGFTYLITNRITTNQGRTDDRTFRIVVVDR